MAYNKFITTDGTALLDLTETSVSAETLVEGVTAVDKNGEKVIGNLNISLQEKTVTKNGTIVPDSAYYGLKAVVVDTPVPQLIAPSFGLLGNNLQITDNNNIAGISLDDLCYDIYIDDTFIKSTANLNINIEEFNLSTGVYGFKAVAKCDKFIDSATSNTVWYAIKPHDYLLFNSPNSFTIQVTTNTKYWDGIIEYSIDLSNWNEWDGVSILSVPEGKLYMRGTGNTVITGPQANSGDGGWILSGSNIYCAGNIETLLDYQTVANGEHPVMGNSCYQYLFTQNNSLINAPDLPATALTEWCYYNMFSTCRSLEKAPELPATVLVKGCYRNMFAGDTNLKIAPKLPAMDLAEQCYFSMFFGCDGLTEAPELPAVVMAMDCYQQMFADCTGLTRTPKLPAEQLAKSCYYSMFYGCTNLTAISELPAKILPDGCYNGMFRYCDKIKVSTTQHDGYQNAYRIPKQKTGVIEEGTIYFPPTEYMFGETGGEFTSVPDINTTYYLENEVIEIRLPPIYEQLNVTQNGEYTADTSVIDAYSKVTVNVPIPEGYVLPEGELKIDAAGIYDVRTYESVNVKDPAQPIKVLTAADMTSLLDTGDIGGVYRYMGETTTEYENYALYMLVAHSASGWVKLCSELPALGTTLEECSWAEISAVAASGRGAEFFNIGDMKSVHISGTIGTLSVDDTYYVYIIGFNHQSDLNGNNIIFGTFKTADGTDVALVTNYATVATDGTKNFSYNHWCNSSIGGWAGSDIRYDILGSTDTPPSGYGGAKEVGVIGYDASVDCATKPVANTLMAALPEDLRNYMRPMLIYTDNAGYIEGQSSRKVTSSVDYLPLLAEFEVFGVNYYADYYEQLHQNQYEYFTTETVSTIKYQANNSTSASNYWIRSSCPQEGWNGIIISNSLDISSDGVSYADLGVADGEIYGENTGYSAGLAPIFRL